MEQRAVELVKEIQNGNRDALSELYQVIYDDIYRLAYANCHNYHDAKDIVQDTFVSVCKSIDQLQDVNAFPYWIQRVVFTATAKYYRRQKTVTMDDNMMAKLNKSEVKEKDFLPKDRFDEQSEQALIRQFVEELKDIHREVIECVYLRQMSLEETSNYLHRPLGTVKSQLHVGRKKLMERIFAFEKENNRKIGFHALGGESLFAAFSLTYWRRFVWLHIQELLNLGLFITGTAFVGISVIGAVEFWQEIQTGNSDVSVQRSTSVLEENASSFYCLFQDKEILTAQDAYFTIVSYAGTPNLLKQKSVEEQEEVRILIRALHAFDGAYAIRLEKEGWLDA